MDLLSQIATFLVAKATHAFIAIWNSVNESVTHFVSHPISQSQQCTPVLFNYFMVGFNSIHYICNTPVDSIKNLLKRSFATVGLFLALLKSSLGHLESCSI